MSDYDRNDAYEDAFNDLREYNTRATYALDRYNTDGEVESVTNLEVRFSITPDEYENGYKLSDGEIEIIEILSDSEAFNVTDSEYAEIRDYLYNTRSIGRSNYHVGMY